MTEAEIMKALEELYEKNINVAEFQVLQPDSVKKLCYIFKDTLDLINRKNAEIERVTRERDNIIKTYTEVVDAWKITRSEAINEYRNKLKSIHRAEVYKYEIDQVAEEMRKEDEGK